MAPHAPYMSSYINPHLPRKSQSQFLQRGKTPPLPGLKPADGQSSRGSSRGQPRGGHLAATFPVYRFQGRVVSRRGLKVCSRI